MQFLKPALQPSAFDEIKNTSLGKLVRDQLLGQIMSGALEPGQALREPDLVEQMKVSRVPVREALRELESMGLVVSRKHSGVYIRELSLQEVADLYAFRSVLDRHAGQMAERLPQPQRDELVAKLQACVQQMDEGLTQGHGQTYYQANLQFHWLFIESTGNREIANSYRDIIQKLHLARLKNLSSQDHRRASNEEHKRIVRALEQSASELAPQACAGLLADHVLNAYRRLAEN
ncbi:GntR family transcriptional regulator [Comamonas sp. BIGb0124]|uniref:GntR family transcriptional regulator n=1 Tax=Comamonas sp. BIGb0124 TaxID=2485130 RepID=UPI000F47DE52|nr:GntR family transcriptional regulator [Comamonas sp. BIGb0124]ROR20463.1 GntR family transcriptional regulator [Comamonas sp. BIGb0124]